MQEFSKYRVITVGFILMFIFVVAAIYTNTKDVVAKKTQQAGINNQQNIIQSDSKNDNDAQENTVNVDVIENAENKNSTNINDDEDLSNKLLLLTDRVGNLEKSVYSQNNSADQGVRCNIRGILDGENIIQMSTDEAIKESKDNGKEIFITCQFK